MTIREFENCICSIRNEMFCADHSDPVIYGIERAAFEGRKLQKLIAFARHVDLKTAKVKVAQWKRQLERVTQTQHRFEKMRDEMKICFPPSSVSMQPCISLSASVADSHMARLACE